MQTGKTWATLTEDETVTTRDGHEPSPSETAIGNARGLGLKSRWTPIYDKPGRLQQKERGSHC